MLDNMLSFDDICKLALLVNVEGLSTANVVGMYTMDRLHRNTAGETASVTSQLADMRLTQADYTSTFQFVLSLMTVKEEQLGKLINEQNDLVAGNKRTWHAKIAAQRKSRISLREVLQSKGLDHTGTCRGHSDGTLSDAASMVSGLDRMGQSVPLHVFCTAIRFPNSMSRLLRLRCYLHACCGHLYDIYQYTERLVAGNIAAAINNNPVHSPDVHSLCQAIETLVLNQEPFRELKLFRDKCFSVLSANHWHSLSLTGFLHLYMCAYQKKELWKSCWKNFFPVMSTQITREIESFVGRTPFAVDAFIKIMQTSTPFIS